MKNKNKYTELTLFASENFEGESYSEPARTIVEKIKPYSHFDQIVPIRLPIYLRARHNRSSHQDFLKYPVFSKSL